METLSAAEALRLVERGAVLIDLRPFPDFARGHPRGALNVPFSPRRLAARIASVVPPGARVILVCANREEGALARLQLVAEGISPAGLIEAERSSWRAVGGGWEALQDLSLEELDRDPDLAVIDVREPEEWATGFVPGAVHIPLARLRDELRLVPSDRPLAVVCESGLRSSTGASLLRAEGFPRVANVPGGTAAWRRSGRPLAFPESKAK
jgi:hydroxyacylglutathione hydrolase